MSRVAPTAGSYSIVRLPSQGGAQSEGEGEGEGPFGVAVFPGGAWRAESLACGGCGSINHGTYISRQIET